MRPPATVVTIGYAGRALDDLVRQLIEHDVGCVADVRALAESTSEGFSGAELSAALAPHEVSYVHLGDLGDFQPVPYEEYVSGPEWAREYRRLVDLAGEGGLALLCRCADVERCHRRAIADRLRDDGFRVVHLSGSTARHALPLD